MFSGMSTSLHISADVEAFQRRFESLRPDAPALWGSLDAHHMLCHVADVMEQALGERPAPDQSTFFLRHVVRFLLLHVMPRMPKGAPTSRAFLAETGGSVPTDFESDRRRVLLAMERCVARPESKPFLPHPAFGALSHAERAILTGKHLDHHLRQFGL
jgi:hypothetical protein